MNPATKTFAGRSYTVRGIADLLQDALRSSRPLGRPSSSPRPGRASRRRWSSRACSCRCLISRPRLHAQLRVEVRQRLVHQERLRLAHDARGPARRAAAGRPTARAASAASSSPMSSISAASRDPAVDLRRVASSASSSRTRGSRTRSCAGRARSPGTPSRCRGRCGASWFTTRSADEDLARA